MKLSLMLQGECTEFTKSIIEEYATLDFVDKIVLSTYATNISLPGYVDVIYNDMIDPRGTGNRNLQINTSRNGLQKIEHEFCVKMRTDQFIRLHSMMKMYEFANKHMQNGRIFVMGMYRAFPYHPRDHVFWGRTEDVRRVFDIPFDLNSDFTQDYEYKTRAETYIGQYYYARFDPSIQEHIHDPLTFTVDTAPRRNEALAKDFAIRDKVFVPFPRVSMSWPKHGLTEYHYHVGESYTEYWSEHD